ncbi:MAG: YdcF family protein [Desulfosarcina sp.]|nr:YdcF family protein [Desulfosarcina sp.]
MFALKKTITPFILPPGIFILAIVLVSLLMVYRRRWKLGLANLIVGLMLWALSTVPLANFLIQGLESGYSIPANPSGDVIILLTAAYHLTRARMAFDAAGMPVTPFPAYFLGSRIIPYAWRHLLPRAVNLHTSANALHEYIGILYYRLVGP